MEIPDIMEIIENRINEKYRKWHKNLAGLTDDEKKQWDKEFEYKKMMLIMKYKYTTDEKVLGEIEAEVIKLYLDSGILLLTEDDLYNMEIEKEQAMYRLADEVGCGERDASEMRCW